MTERWSGDLRGLRQFPGSSPGKLSQLRGTVAEGVEAGCTVLLDDDGAVLANLSGFDRAAFPVGSKIVATGFFDPDLISTCQQGQVFRVASVRLT